METVNFFVLVILFVILLSLNSFIRKYITKNTSDIAYLQKTLNEIKQRLNNVDTLEAKPAKEQTLAASTKPTEAKVSEPIQKPVETVKKEINETKTEKPVVQKPVARAVISSTQKKQVPQKDRKSFFERNPDFEKFIGENLINKIGIVILVLGLAISVKYAIDKHWINEIGRVAIGILSAGVLIGFAHKLRLNYKSFSSVLVGGGLALLYFTITFAFHTQGYPLYQQQKAAFLILVLITMFAVLLSLAYNRIEIAILAIVGGFSSPLMLANGSGNYIILFTYMMVLNVGMLFLSYYKKWRLVNIVAFGFTVLLFALWLGKELINSNYSTFHGAIFFATGFYIIFFLMNIIYNLKNNIVFKVGDISLVLSNTFIYFSFAMLMLQHINNGAYKGLFAILLGAFNFAFAYFVHSRQKTDTNLLYLLIGLVFTFVTLAIPLQLKGNYITLFWSIEGVLLLWLGQKSGFKIMKLGSVIVTALMLISLAMDWAQSYKTIAIHSSEYIKQLNFIFNKVFITSLISGLSLVFNLLLLKTEKESDFWIFPVSIYKAMVLAAMFIVFYVGGLLEVNYQALHFFTHGVSQSVATYTYNSVYILTLLLFAYKINKQKLSITASAISTLFVLVFFGALSSVYAQSTMLTINGNEELSTLLLVFRWISITAVYCIAFLLFKLVNKANGMKKDQLYKFNMATFVFTIIYLLSADLDTFGLLIAQSKDALMHTQKTGYAILWAISSFILMLVGMKKKEQIIRILSLLLFAITIIKLFVYDISNISEGAKIVAFILLGVLLLIISFMYQKVKKLLLNDESDNLKQEISNTTTKE